MPKLLVGAPSHRTVVLACEGQFTLGIVPEKVGVVVKGTLAVEEGELERFQLSNFNP